MSLHAAITSFLDQGLDVVGVSALSCLASSLSEPTVAAALIDQHRGVCNELMSRLVAVANSNEKNPNARILAVESLYALSNAANDSFRTGDLLDAVQQLNESFEEFLETHSSGGVDSQHKMLTVLLFRCSGYSRIKAGDFLKQLYNGDDIRFVSTLQEIMKDRTFEWDILQACMRCMYELTTPSSYFTAPADESQPIETTKMNAFQEKITVLLIHLTQHNVLHDLFDELAARWSIAMREDALEPMIEGQAPVTDAVCDGAAMRFLGIFRYLTIMLLNVADFCERMDLVRSYQQSFILQHQNFLGGTIIPFLRLAFRCWEMSRDSGLESQNNPFMNVIIGVLRLLRFVLYRPPQVPGDVLLLPLASLTRQVHALESRLCKEYVGMLALVLTVESLCNVNAANLPALANDFTALITLTASDTNPLRAGSQFTVSQAFTYCLANETSSYCVPENESVSMLRGKLHFDDVEMTNEAQRAIEALEEQLGMLQALMMELAVGQLLGDLSVLIPLGVMPPDNRHNLGRKGTDTNQQTSSSGTVRSNNSSEEKQQRTINPKKKNKHPPQYVCMLTKKLMREPVVLRNGHHFEFDALQEVVDRVGHVDPITGEAFNDEIEVDMGLQQEIARYRIEAATRAGDEATA